MLGRIICTCIAARLPLRSFLGRSTAALHLDSTCRELLDAVASLFVVARLITASAAFPLAEQIVYALQNAERIVRTRLPTEILAHACVDINSKTSFLCAFPRLPLRSFLGRSSAALHLDSSCRELLDAGATLFIVTRLTTTSAAFPLAEQIVCAWQNYLHMHSCQTPLAFFSWTQYCCTSP